MQEDVLYARYAKALAMFAKERHEISKIAEEIKCFTRILCESQEVAKVFYHPEISRGDKLKILHEICASIGFSQGTQNFLSVLVKRKRLDGLEKILFKYRELGDIFENRSRVEVESVVELSKEILKDFRDKLSMIFRCEVILGLSTNPSLIGGIKIKVENTIYDGSIKGRLGAIRRSLI